MAAGPGDYVAWRGFNGARGVAASVAGGTLLVRTQHGGQVEVDPASVATWQPGRNAYTQDINLDRR